MVEQRSAHPPLISVILATRNCASCLPAALDSLFGQRTADYECIIVDGGSTDGTLDIIREQEKKIARWISEPDEGIADAFNKGIQLSSGRLLYFMGADDELHDDLVLRDVAEVLPRMREPYFFYGDIVYTYKKKRKLIRRNFRYSKFIRYNCVPHQAMFMDRWFVDAYGPFRPEYKYAMDYEHIARFVEQYPPQYFARTIARMHRYGMSSNVIAAHDEMDRIRLSRGWTTENRVMLDRIVLRLKLAVARTFALNW